MENINYGRHILFDFKGIKADIHNPEFMRAIMTEAINRTGATILNVHHHRFSPDGLSVAFILQESHMTVHTWYETQACIFDIYTCGAIQPNKAYEYLLSELKPERYSMKEMGRGRFYNWFFMESWLRVKQEIHDFFVLPVMALRKAVSFIL